MNRSPRWLLAAGATLALGLAAAPAATADSTSTSTAAIASSDIANVGRSASLANRFGIDRLPVAEAVNAAVTATPCTATDFDAYFKGLVQGLSRPELLFLINHIEMLDIPTYDALLYGTASDARYNLRSDYKQSLVKTFADVKRFWDITSSDIQLISMHGEVLGDADRVKRTLVNVFGYSEKDAATYATDVANAVNSGMFNHGKSPLFTLNAFAFSAQGDDDPLVQGVPDKLVFGDGIVDALNTLGLADVGPRAVMGHEFGHHVQFEDNLFESQYTGAEATRRTELMADAFGTYFTVHARGLALNTKRVLQVEKSFYEVGDCQFTSDGHHGTPLQREASSTWAANLANSARPQGYILPSLQFDKLFEAELPKLVAPTAS